MLACYIEDVLYTLRKKDVSDPIQQRRIMCWLQPDEIYFTPDLE